MKNFKNIFYILLILSGLTTCRKEEVASMEYPRLNTLEVTDVSESGAVFNAEIISGNVSEVIEYGFVWGLTISPYTSINDQQIIQGKLNSTRFSAQIHSGMVKGVTYYAKPYIKTSTTLVYGKYVSFVSQGSDAPVILDFTPKNGTWGDTIKITGKNFRSINKDVVVKLGDLVVPVASICDSIIRFAIPDKDNFLTPNLSVTIMGKTIVGTSSFTYKLPVITSVTPETVTFNDTIYIRGTNLISKKIAPQVNLNNLKMVLAYSSENLIKIVMPVSYGVKTSTVNVKGPTGFITSVTTLKLKDLLINSFTPDSIHLQTGIVTINGANFNPVISNNKVLIDGVQAQILEGSTQRLVVQFPEAIVPDHEVSVIKGAGITINVGELSAKASKDLQIDWRSKWTRKNAFPGNIRAGGIAFTIGSKGYFGIGAGSGLFKDFWEYDSLTDLWTRKADFPGVCRLNETAIVMKGKAYVGLGIGYNSHDTFKDFYQYDPATDSWTKLADYGGKARGDALSWVSNGRIYLGAGLRYPDPGESPVGYEIYMDDCWSYDLITNVWKEELKIPDISTRDVILTIDNSIYKLSTWKSSQFNGTTWDELPNITSINGNSSQLLPFNLGSTGYINSIYNVVYVYNPASGYFSTIKVPDIVFRYYPSVFTIGAKAYFVGGRNSYNTADSFIWEFDPSKP
ncbi:MAG: IPT/TIG domain-containing protein [Mariniphaga sp.]